MKDPQVDKVIKAIKIVEQLEAKTDQARKERAIAIRQAVNAGLKATEIADASGMPLPSIRADLLRTKDQ